MPRSFSYPFRFRWAFLAFQLRFVSFFLSLLPFLPSFPPPVTKRCGTPKRGMIDDESGRQIWFLEPFLSLPPTTCKEGLEGREREKRPLVVGHVVPKHVRMEGSETTPIRW